MQHCLKHLLFSHTPKPAPIKKIITIAFLLMLFLSQLGYHLIYTFRQYEAKEEAKEKLLAVIPKLLLKIIDADANKNDIEWEEEGREFYLHGQMYDVASIKEIDGKKLIYCLNDKKEEQLLNDLSKAITAGNDQPSNNKHGQHTIKFQLPDYILFLENTATAYQAVRQKHFDYPVALFSIATDVNTPPPDLIF